ncbi:MAG TPA: VWA domain-containing protein [Acidobacteriaceae bacterium]
MQRFRRPLRLAIALVVFSASLWGQGSGGPATPAGSELSESGEAVPTLHAGTHMVVLDVVVTDKKGHTVPGLTQDAFRIYEGGKPQTVKFFEEHAPLNAAALAREKSELAAKLPVNTFTNYEPFTGNPPIVLLVNEVGSLPQYDYAPLYMRLRALIHNAPAETPFVVYELDSQLRLVLPLTTNREAVEKTVDTLWRKAHFSPADNASDSVILNRRKVFTSAMQQLSAVFASARERKTIFALTGGLQCALGLPKVNCTDPLPTRAATDLKTYLCSVMDILEQGRFSLYRYYPNGQIVYGFGCEDSRASLQQVFETNSHYYTFYYSPTDVDWNGKYRSFKVDLADRNLRPSYRAGYYARPENTAAGHYLEAADKPGREGFAGRDVKVTATSDGPAAPDAEGDRTPAVTPNPVPVVFTVQVIPAATTGTAPQATPPTAGNAESEADRVQGYRDYTLRFTVPVAGLRVARELKAGQTPAYTAHIQIAAVSYVHGSSADAKTSQFTASFDGPSDPRIAKGEITASLTLQVPEKGKRLLRVTVRDVSSRQEGTLDIPVEKIVLPAK